MRGGFLSDNSAWFILGQDEAVSRQCSPVALNPRMTSQYPMELNSASLKIRLVKLWWVPCLLAIPCLLAVAFIKPMTFDLGSKSYSLRAEALAPNGPSSGRGVFVRLGQWGAGSPAVRRRRLDPKVDCHCH
jgi:hypothetical protein